MAESTHKRRYQSPRREEQAQATRQRILDAATRLFATQGYAASTLPAIASAAGVSAPTVTAVFGTKLALLDALIKESVRGDPDPRPLALRPWWRDMLNEPDPSRQLTLYAEHTQGIHERTSEIREIVRSAAAVDSQIAALLRHLGESRLGDVRGLAESLAAKQALQPGMTVDRTTDILWTLGSADVYRLLVIDRGWPLEQYQAWLASTLILSLLK